MLKHSNRPAAPNAPALLSYEVNGVPISLHADGTLNIGNHELHQQTVFALAIGLRLPGMHPMITRLERLRQEADHLEDGSDQVHDRR
jgi:hypothetical protein